MQFLFVRFQKNCDSESVANTHQTGMVDWSHCGGIANSAKIRSKVTLSCIHTGSYSDFISLANSFRIES